MGFQRRSRIKFQFQGSSSRTNKHFQGTIKPALISESAFFRYAFMILTSSAKPISEPSKLPDGIEEFVSNLTRILDTCSLYVFRFERSELERDKRICFFRTDLKGSSGCVRSSVFDQAESIDQNCCSRRMFRKRCRSGSLYYVLEARLT